MRKPPLDPLGASPRTLHRGERDPPANVLGKDQGRVLRLELESDGGRGQPEALDRFAGMHVVVDVLRRLSRHQREVGRAEEAGKQIELQARREGAAEVAVHHLHPLPARHDPSHRSQAERVGAERLVGHAVFAVAGIPLDDPRWTA